MTYSTEQSCPLCGASGKYEPIDYGRDKHFLCSEGCEYVITGSAENLVKSSPAWKDELSKQAKQRKPGKILVVSGEFHPSDPARVHGDWVPRDSFHELSATPGI